MLGLIVTEHMHSEFKQCSIKQFDVNFTGINLDHTTGRDLHESPTPSLLAKDASLLSAISRILQALTIFDHLPISFFFQNNFLYHFILSNSHFNSLKCQVLSL